MDDPVALILAMPSRFQGENQRVKLAECSECHGGAWIPRDAISEAEKMGRPVIACMDCVDAALSRYQDLGPGVRQSAEFIAEAYRKQEGAHAPGR